MKSSKFFGSANFASANANTAHDAFDWDDFEGKKAYAENPMHELLKTGHMPIKHPELRDLLHGTVVGVGDKDYFVSIPGVASDAMLPFREAEGVLSPGDSVDLYVLGVLPKSDAPMIVSQKRAAVWIELQNVQEEGQPVQVRVKEVVRRGERMTGLKVVYNDQLEGFIPRAHLSRQTISNPLAGETMTVKIVKASPKGKYSSAAVFSDRLYANDVADKTLAELQVGEIVSGKVAKFVIAQNSTREIGALVSIADGAFTAFMHASEIAENRRPSSVLKVDEEIEVQVLSINKSKREAKVSYRGAQALQLSAGLTVGAVIPATVMRFKEKIGFFVSIGNGFTALLPCSQVTDGRNVNVKPFFKAGDVIQVLLTELNLDENRAIVSYKQAAIRALESGKTYNGVINKIMPEVGLYVVCEGVGGLLHFSELLKGERIGNFRAGETVEVSLKRISETNDNRTLVAWARRNSA